MKKLNFYFLFLLGFTINAQKSPESPPVVAPTTVVEEVIEEYDDEYDYTPHATPSKEEIGEVYYEKRNLDPDFKNKYKGDKFDYDRIVKEKKRKPPSPPFFSLPTGIFQFLMYVVLGIIILMIIYFIVKNAGGFSFGKEQKKIKFDASGEQELEDEDNIENNDFYRLIQKAKSDKEFRKAIRYYHLWVLQSLSDKKIIRWNKDKTDYDYYQELAQNPIKEDFSNAVYLYDYIWYGNFQLNQDEFTKAESIFQRTLNKLK